MDTKIKCILIYNISSEWKSFAHGAVFDKDVIDYIDLDKRSDQFKMDELLEMLVIRNPSNYISDIEKSLLLMGKKDVLNEIQSVRKFKQRFFYKLN